jgi:hypothetical protein
MKVLGVAIPVASSGGILAAAALRGIANSPVLTNLLDQPLGLSNRTVTCITYAANVIAAYGGEETSCQRTMILSSLPTFALDILDVQRYCSYGPVQNGSRVSRRSCETRQQQVPRGC